MDEKQLRDIDLSKVRLVPTSVTNTNCYDCDCGDGCDDNDGCDCHGCD